MMLRFLGLQKQKPQLQEKQPYNQEPDREQDGFLLVGETASEKSAKGQSTWYTDAPPSYISQVNLKKQGAVQQNPNQFQFNMGANQSTKPGEDTTLGTQEVSSHVPAPKADYLTLTQDHFSYQKSIAPEPVNQTPAPPKAIQGSSVPVVFQEPLAPKSVYEDIPFKLNPVLELHTRQMGASSVLTAIQKPNLGHYYYDFSLERSTLKCNSLP